jgi:ATP-binding cassette subfamily B protein
MFGIMPTIKAATMGDSKRLHPMIIWTFIEYLFRGAPYGILLVVIWELFKPLENPGATIDFHLLLMLTLALAGSLILLFVITKIAYDKCYTRPYACCSERRISIAKQLRSL